MARPVHRSRPTKGLTPILRSWAAREYFMARAVRRSSPVVTVPPGTDPDDWRLYVSAGARPLLDEIERLGIWDPACEGEA